MVWVLFNTLIAFMLMEMNVFRALGEVLGLYSNIAIAWMMAVVAVLVINKPLGLSPKGIEFKGAHLYAINPVGGGSPAPASSSSVAAPPGFHLARSSYVTVVYKARVGAPPYTDPLSPGGGVASRFPFGGGARTGGAFSGVWRAHASSLQGAR